jgi:hypothetical protein
VAPPATAVIAPSYDGRGLLNLVAELERRLHGDALAHGLESGFSHLIPTASSYGLILFDGLGDHQLRHPEAGPLASSRRAVLDSPFPTTTTVSMATVVTGMSPAAHGVIGHLLWLPELGRVVNTLKWVDLSGGAVTYPTMDLLPAPNLWERLSASGINCVTVQPAGFSSTPLTAALYRGCRFVGVKTESEYVLRTLEALSTAGTLVFTYFPPIDYAAHVWGQNSAEYGDAIRAAVNVWEGIIRMLPSDAAVVGTADHGVAGIPEEGKILIRDDIYRPLDFWGDPRAVMVRGSQRLINRLAVETGAELVGPDRFLPWLGPGAQHGQLGARLPDALLLAPFGKVLLPPGFDKRLVGYHGGLTPEELKIPLLVAG